MRFQAKNVSVGETCDEYFQVSFDCEPPGVDDFDPSAPDKPLDHGCDWYERAPGMPASMRSSYFREW